MMTNTSYISASNGCPDKFLKIIFKVYFFNYEGRIMQILLMRSAINYLKSVLNRILNFGFIYLYGRFFGGKHLKNENNYENENTESFNILFSTGFRCLYTDS